MKNKGLIVTLLAMLCCLTMKAGQASGAVYEKSDSITVCRLLSEARQQPRSTNFTLFFARKFIEKWRKNSLLHTKNARKWLLRLLKS